MSEDLLIRHCSPTLAGIKTGNLFSCACPSRKDLTRDLCRLNKKLVPRGIRILRTLADEDHVMFGGDFPYTPISMVADNKRGMDEEPYLDDIREKLYWKNAQALFGIK